MTVHLVAPPRHEPCREIVGLLEEALADARAGLLTDVLIVMTRHGERWAWLSSGTMNFTSYIGKLEVVKNELLRQAHEDRDGGGSAA